MHKYTATITLTTLTEREALLSYDQVNHFEWLYTTWAMKAICVAGKGDVRFELCGLDQFDPHTLQATARYRSVAPTRATAICDVLTGVFVGVVAARGGLDYAVWVSVDLV